MSFVQVIIWVWLIFFFIQKAKKADVQKKNTPTMSSSGQATDAYASREKYAAATARPQTNGNRQPENREMTTGQRVNGNAMHHKQKPVNANSKAATAAVAVTPSKQEKSTTQLLHEKAMKDQMEHRKEKRKQEMENERIHGRLHYAQRLWVGDPVPKGKRLVYCAYCNAENLVPAHDYSTKYNCYFCREIL